MLTTLANYRLITQDMTRSLKQTAAQPQVARESKVYLERIQNVKSIDEFMKDDRVFTYAMKAFGLSDMIYAKAFIRKVLTEGIDNRTSFANTLVDQRYKQFAETFNFKRFGATTTVFESTRKGTVDRYVRQTLEENAGQQNEGVRLALYFERKASTLTSAYSILADAALLKVAQTALGIPAAASAQSIEQQATKINERLKVADLKDPEKLKKFLTRFASLWELQNPTSAPMSAAMLIAPTTGPALGEGLLGALQRLRLGGF